MKYFSLFLLALVSLSLSAGCKKSNRKASLTGTHFFTGTADYVFPGFVSFPTAKLLNQPDTFSTTFTRSSSPDSSDYYYLPATALEPGPLGGTYLVFTTTAQSPSSVPVVIRLTDTLITIPQQLPWSGGDLMVDGDGSFVNNRITLRYHSDYRLYDKYDTAISFR